MESQLSNALLDVKLPYKFMKKEYFEFCEYCRKKWGKIKKFVIFIKFQKFEFLTNETLKERNSIDDNFTTKYRKSTNDTASESPKFKLFIEEIFGK